MNEINEWNKPKEVKEKMEHKYESREQVKQKSNRRKVTYYKKVGRRKKKEWKEEMNKNRKEKEKDI